MTTLNAKANAAYHAMVEQVERDNPGDVWAGFDHERDAFETGYETGYEARPLPTLEQIAETLHRDNHALGDPRCRQHLNGELTTCYERNMHDASRVLELFNGGPS